jgi:hypothetical protein
MRPRSSWLRPGLEEFEFPRNPAARWPSDFDQSFISGIRGDGELVIAGGHGLVLRPKQVSTRRFCPACPCPTMNHRETPGIGCTTHACLCLETPSTIANQDPNL